MNIFDIKEIKKKIYEYSKNRYSPEVIYTKKQDKKAKFGIQFAKQLKKRIKRTTAKINLDTNNIKLK